MGKWVSPTARWDPAKREESQYKPQNVAQTVLLLLLLHEFKPQLSIPLYTSVLLYFQPDYQDNQVKTIICHFALFLLFIWSQVTVAAAKLGIPHMLSPSYTFQFLLWDPKFLPGQMKHIISPVGSGSTLKSPPSMACLKNLQVDIQESFGQEGTATLLRAAPWCLSPGTLQGNPFDLVLLVSAQLTGLAEADLP